MNLHQHLNVGDPAFFTIPGSGILISQLLLLNGVQGGNFGAYALGDYSAGTIIGMLPFNTIKDVLCVERVAARNLENIFEPATTARSLGVIRLIL